MICYTAVYGGKDKPLLPPRKEAGIEYVCFTDRDFKAPGWDVRKAKRKESTFRLQAKWFKMHPHELFPGEKTLWVDGNTRGRFDVKPYFEQLGDAPIGVFKHAVRECAYDELYTCIDRAADHYDSLIKLETFLRNEKYPGQEGIYIGKTIWRTPASSELNLLWWNVIRKTSSRDQVSLPYVLWKLNIKPIVFGLWDDAVVPVIKSGPHLFHGTVEANGTKTKFRTRHDEMGVKK